MPRVKPEDRKRAKRPKTRSGCKTCKIRRVKCDEARPSCQRCLSTGRTCDGYGFNSDLSTAGNVTLGAIVGSMPSIFKSEKEHRSFAFFLERTSRQLAGHYDCDFWHRIIVQAAQIDTGIRCSIVALGSLHETFEKSGGAETETDDFALENYGLAIRQQLNDLAKLQSGSGETDAYVASCMLFMCIELIQGHYVSATSLLKGAVKLFYDREMHARSSSAWPIEVFETILSRMQSQALVVLDSKFLLGQTVPPRLGQATITSMPKQFRSVLEAKRYLEFYSQSAALSKSTTKEEARNPTLHKDMLSHWTSAFDSMLAAHVDNLTAEDRRAAKILRMWTLVVESELAIMVDDPSAGPNAMLHDRHIATYAEVVRLAACVLQSVGMTSDGSTSGTTHQFTLDFGTVGPLYDTACLCRDPVIRRRAIHLLRAFPIREGYWDSLLAARSAERCMEIEESAVAGTVETASDVPSWARIRSIKPSFEPGARWASVMYQRSPVSNGSEQQCFREIIEW